jgi:ferric-dicitrate binding protein FerR (iron transport regulator)
MDESIKKLFEEFIQGTISPTDEAVLIDFIRTDADLARRFEADLTSQSHYIDKERSDRMLARIESEIKPDSNKVKHTRLYKKLMRVAAIMAIPIVSVFATLHISRLHEASTDRTLTVSAAEGQKANLTLPDGTKVWLNSGTTLSYSPDFNRRDRVVELDGEAYFDVAYDKRKMFSVNTEGMRINVFGTSFNVKNHDADRYASATLVHGSIEAITDNGAFMQQPNQRLVYDKRLNRTTPPIEVAVKDYTEWRNNILRFANESLAEIVSTLERHYNVDIIISDAELNNMRISGTMPNTGLKSIMEVLSLTSPILYKFDGMKIILSIDKSRRKQYKF